MTSLASFWSYALAACLFASLILWRLRGRVEGTARLLVAGYFATAVWASVSAMRGPTDLLTMPAETLRNLVWLVMLHAMWSDIKDEAGSALRLVFGAVALVIGTQFALNLLILLTPLGADLSQDVLMSERLLRITMASGALVLLHNLYGQATPASRVAIRGPMLGLSLMWGYDLNLYTLAYLHAPGAGQLFDWRGVVVAIAGALFVVSQPSRDTLRIRLSRAATFQSLSMLGICIYFAVMALVATALRRSHLDWAAIVTAIGLSAMIVATAVLALSHWARGWAKVKIAKHLFEHRYDYRSEWLRFADTVGRSDGDALPIGERLIKAFADILEAPGGLLLVPDSSGALTAAAAWNWTGRTPPQCGPDESRPFWSSVEDTGRILDLDAYRRGVLGNTDRQVLMPEWLADDGNAWAGVPLIHHERLVGLVLIGAPEYRRPLDWEDFDLLRTAGRQAASSLAESFSQEALADARRFEEFNRRFAFILHDVKNLVSQLSLLARNAERHADNPDFRADMVATLQSSVGKMNELLARLAPHSPARVQRLAPEPLRAVLTAAIATRRGDHDVRLLGDTNQWALFDAAALEQAIGHLLQNAVEACSPALPVTVRVGNTADTVSIAITDKGVGMDSDFLRNRLFQPFASSKPGGFGIGAFEARSLITAMGGRLTVDSQPGRGTTFTIMLPAAEANSGPAKQPERKRA
jgi:putative PEP-CTERM system histidine kinase